MVVDILFGIVVVGMHGQQDVVCSVDVGVVYVYLCGRHDTPSTLALRETITCYREIDCSIVHVHATYHVTVQYCKTKTDCWDLGGGV